MLKDNTITRFYINITTINEFNCREAYNLNYFIEMVNGNVCRAPMIDNIDCVANTLHKLLHQENPRIISGNLIAEECSDFNNRPVFNKIINIPIPNREKLLEILNHIENILNPDMRHRNRMTLT